MLDFFASIGRLFDARDAQATLSMTTNDRMAGSVPVWQRPQSAKDETLSRFAQALEATESEISGRSFASTFAEDAVGSKASAAQIESEPFGFGDLIDIINPLQHIPVINTVYRHLTGDEIRGSGKVLGGALFGGPLGAAGSMVNLIVEHETGKDLPELALGILNGEEVRSAHRQNAQQQKDLTAALLAYEGTSHKSTFSFNS